MSYDTLDNPFEGKFESAHSVPDQTGFVLEEPVWVKGLQVTYDRKFNLGNFESLNPAITIWVKTRVPEGMDFDLSDCKERVRRMARENVRRQWQQLQGNNEVVFLGLQPPAKGGEDPIFVRTVSVSLVYKVNLGNYQSITPGYTDWADLRHVSHSPGELHMALDRMWQSLWQNTWDEISRAQGKGGTSGFFGLPTIAVEDLTRSGGLTNGQNPAAGVVIPSMQSSSAPARPINGKGG